jgi:hypothetical protein
MCLGIVWWNCESNTAMLRAEGREEMHDFIISRAEALCKGARSVRASRWW